jgi:UDP-N-acetylglucosamine 2-epimerase (non-hydrolysing)
LSEIDFRPLIRRISGSPFIEIGAGRNAHALDRHHRRRAAEFHEDRAHHPRARGTPGGRRFTLRYRLVHTGQHYDARMSGDFFAQLGIPEPDVNLEVGSGSQAEQTAAIMTRYERLLLEAPSRLCLVVGDVTSTMACAIAAQKLCIPVAHVEAGHPLGRLDHARGDQSDGDGCDHQLVLHHQRGGQRQSAPGGRGGERIFFVGNTMIDSLLANLPRLRRPPFWDELSLQAGEYFVLTLHRPANVDQGDGFARLLAAIGTGTRGLPVVFPVHPRTAKTLHELGEVPPNLRLVDPQPYLEFNYLVRSAKAVITDSGGITEETTVMGVPCLTLRDSTERPETVTIGTNELIGTDPAKLGPALDRLFAGWKQGAIPENWDANRASILEGWKTPNRA